MILLLGAFHSGVEIFGREYTFAKGGIFYTPPREVPGPAKFRESVDMVYYKNTSKYDNYLFIYLGYSRYESKRFRLCSR